MRAGLLALLTLCAYSSTLRGGFIWDDDSYVVENAALTSPDGLERIWLDPSATPQYYPLVHTSFRVERRLWGLQPFGYHLTNVLLHLASALLLWAVLSALEVPWPWFAAALFAVHPVNVESVAWVTERKNVLSATLELGAALFYLRYLGWGSLTPGRRRDYAVSLLLFIGAMLSKTVACSLPAALLLVIWWKRGRIGWRDVAELLPFFFVGLTLGANTALLERMHVHAEGPDWNFTLAQRCLIAGHALWFYLGKLAWPVRLSFIYTRWTLGAPLQWSYPVAAVGAAAALWALRERLGRGPLVAALYFAGTLLPALGFVNVYPMLFSFVADHFQYFASLGPFALAAAGLARLAERHDVLARRAAGAVLAVLCLLTWMRGRDFYSQDTLWTDTLSKNPGCWMCDVNLGEVRRKEGRSAEALALFERAMTLHPNHRTVLNGLGAFLLSRGDLNGAEHLLRASLALEPRQAMVMNNLGVVFLNTGRVRRAADMFAWAVRFDPSFDSARANLKYAQAHLP